MPDISWEHAAEARAALSAIVTDPGHGVAALSSAQTMSNLLKDLLPDAPREKSILVAAAEAGLAETLREHVAQGMDPSTAIRLTASSFSTSTPFTPEACTWVAGELAIALGISQADSGGGVADQPWQAGPGQIDQREMPTQIAQIPGFAAGQATAQDAAQAAPQAYPIQVAPQAYPQAPPSPGPAYPQAPPSPGPAYPQAPPSPGQFYPTQETPQAYPGAGMPAGGSGAGVPAGGYGPGFPAGGYGAAAPPGTPVGGYGPGIPAGTPVGGYAPGAPVGGYGPGTPVGGYGPGGPGGPGGRPPGTSSGRKRGLLVVGGVVVGIIVIIVIAATLSSKGTPVESLSTIMNPTGSSPVGTSCQRATLNGLNPATITNRTYCTSTSISGVPANGIVVWAYQFDSYNDYLAGFSQVNSITGFKSSGAVHHCTNPPPALGQYGSTTWSALHNPKYGKSQESGQHLECFIEFTKTHLHEPLLIWTMSSQYVVFIGRDGAPGATLPQLFNWWAHLSYG